MKNSKFKLKGDGPVSYHLGLNYIRDKDEILKQQSIQYIEKMVASYKQMFDSVPKKYKTPLDKGDHPKIDASELHDKDCIKFYLTMIGKIQWCVDLGRIDIFSASVTMFSFCAAPRINRLV
jgi:hypothetical protein